MLDQKFVVKLKPNKDASVDWVEKASIVVAVAAVVGAGNDWQKERQFFKLNKKVLLRSLKFLLIDNNCIRRKKIVHSWLFALEGHYRYLIS